MSRTVKDKLTEIYHDEPLSSEARSRIANALRAQVSEQSSTKVSLVESSRGAKGFSKNFVIAASGWLVAAALFLLVVSPKPQDLWSSPAPFRETSYFPADFDLEGNPDNLPTVVENTLGQHGKSFPVSFPTRISERYDPGEGRFISWHGSQGVSINLEDRKESTTARLFLFHTPDRENGLGAAVQGDVVRNLNVGGRRLPAKVWREGESTFVLFEAGMGE